MRHATLLFAVAAQSCGQYDYRGREPGKSGQARELAELFALDIECIDGGDLAGTDVRVRNVSGQQLNSVPIRRPNLIAA